MGRALGRVLLLAEPRRRSIALENMRRCLPEWDDRRLQALLRENYEHYGVLALELAHMLAPLEGHYRGYVRRVARVEGLEHWEQARLRGKGALFCSAHLANWELAAASGALQGMPVTIVTRRLKPAWLHAWMEKARRSTQVRCAYQPRTMPTVLKALRDGGGVVFVMDQYMPPPMGEPTLFFGVQVDTLAALAPLARRTGAAILPVRQVRRADGIVRIIIEPEVVLGDDDKSDNQRLAAIVEGWIRSEPAQWLWVHRRFKNVDWPVGPKPSRPFEGRPG